MNSRMRTPPRPLRLGFFSLLALSLPLWLAPALPSAAQGMLLPTTTLTLGKRQAHVEIAATDASRARGLMFRTQLPADHGMIFVYSHDNRGCFWMKNTPLPLSIAFIDRDGVILNILDMPPLTLDEYCPTGPMRYALEMSQGWFRQAGIRPGDRVDGLP